MITRSVAFFTSIRRNKSAIGWPSSELGIDTCISLSCLWYTAATLEPEIAGKPVRHSKKTNPQTYKSVLVVAGSPRSCSGALYDGVPSVSCVMVSVLKSGRRLSCVNVPIPKSRILAWVLAPVLLSMMLAGLISL